MGVVWRAVDERLERSVAVKKIVGQYGLSELDRADLHRRAMREAKIAARLQHPNAIVVFDITEHEGDPCLVMEYLPSHSLSEILARSGTLSVPEVARIGEQVGSALVAAHQAGIVHRDVKPGNILIDETGVAKLTDFGISRAQGDMTLTATGLVGGTPAYIAPELARGADPAPTSDVFALGATLYHAIEGQSPYGSNPNQLALLHTAASGKINPPQSAGPATALLMSMLRPEPEERITMRQAGERLAAIASGGGVPAPPPPVLPVRPPKERKSPPWQRTKTATPAAAAAAPAPTAHLTDLAPAGRSGSGAHGTAMFNAVDAPSPRPASRPAPRPAAPPPRRPAQERRRKNAGFYAAVAGLVALIGVVAVLLLNNENPAGQAASPPGNGQTTTTEPETTTPNSESQDPGSGPIDLGTAGQLMVDYYSFPQGIDASWNMLTPSAQQQFGDKEKFEKYWSRFESAYARTVTGKYNDDGSVTMTGTVVSKRDGKERSERVSVRVVRTDGKLLIDSRAEAN